MSSMNTIASLRAKLDNREISSRELTQEYLDRAKKENERLNAFVTIDESAAMEMAEEADIKIAKDQATALTGIPYGVKDAICTEGLRSTGSAKILDNYTAPYQATVIKKIQAQGGVIIGKQNCDSFGHGASNENSMYGAVKNPWDVSRVPGGSSGGSAAAPAADMCVYSIAEDTGGSIRQPASFCNMVGLRPSYGRNSRYGIMPMASSLDTVGPVTKTVSDMAAVMSVMAGQDPFDSTTVPESPDDYVKKLGSDIKELTVGLPREYVEELSDEMRGIVEKAADQMRMLGAHVVDVSLPHTKYAIAVYYVVVPCEDSSNLARLDGIRYGVRGEGKKLQEVYESARTQGFPDEVKRRIMIGTFALSHGYYDAYYKKAQKVRTLIIRDFENVFNDVDVIMAPTTPNPAFKIGEMADDPLAMYLQDKFVCPAAVAGVPALSVPGGFIDGLPVGVQFIGPRLSEGLLMRTGLNYEAATQFGTMQPE